MHITNIARSIRQEEQRTVTVYVGAECMYTLSIITVCLTGTALTVIGEN